MATTCRILGIMCMHMCILYRCICVKLEVLDTNISGVIDINATRTWLSKEVYLEYCQ